jgi:hypothetical protein
MSEVKVEIKADSSALATGLAKAQKNIQNFGKDVTTNITDKLAGAFTGGAVIAGIGALAAGVLSAGKSIMDFAGNLQDASDAMGVTVEQLQGLHGAFMLGGASAEDVDKGISKLLQNMDTATNSVGPIRDAFDKLGVSFETLSSGDPNAVILAIADGVKNAKNPTEAYAAALDLLGKAGKKMMAGLIDGGGALDAISKKVEKLSNEDNAAIAKFGDAVDVLKGKLMVLGAKAATPLFGELNAAMDETTPKLSRFARIAAMIQSSTTLGGFLTNAVSGFSQEKKPPPPKTEDFFGPTMAELTAPVFVDPKIKAAEEAQAKMDDENQKKADAYAEKQQANADKIAGLQEKNASDAEETRRAQLTEEKQINKLIEDRMHLEMEVANTKGEQQALAQKDLQDVEKLIAAKTEGLANEGRAKAKEQMGMDAENAKKAEDFKDKQEKLKKEAEEKKKGIADAQAKGAADIAGANKTFMDKQMGIVGKMADEEMKTPLQRANEDRIATEKDRVEASIKRRIERGTMSGMSSKAMGKLQNELAENAKNLPDELAKLTKEMQAVVDKINKG